MIEIKDTIVKKIAYLYISLPVICFLFFYMNSWIGRGLSLVFLALLCLALRKEKITKENAAENPIGSFHISIRALILLGVIAIAWSYLGGQGNLYYQSDDWHARNAIYRDIIYHDWPVVFPDTDTALVYYIGHWLPPAVITKWLGIIAPHIYETDLAFRLGNIFMWIWTSVGVFLVECLLITYAKPTGRRIWLAPLILVFFSGFDFLGALFRIVTINQTFSLHIEWWSPGLQFSSLTTCLFWVFNQTVVPWIVMLCVLQENTLKRYVFLGLGALATGPMPFVGIVTYMLVYAVYRGILMLRAGKEQTIRFFKEMLSIENWLGVVIVPVFALYYSSNSAVNTNAEASQTGSFLGLTFSFVNADFIRQVIFFLLLEAGVYLIILFRKYKKDIFWYITLGSLILAPFVRIGMGSDFVMRYSIPAIMTLAAMSLRFLAEYQPEKAEKKDRICCIALCICLAIGALNPLTEFARGYNQTLATGRLVNVADGLGTMNIGTAGDNCLTHDYKNTPFFRYLAPGKTEEKE